MSEEKLSSQEHQAHNEAEPNNAELEARPNNPELDSHRSEKEPIDVEAASKKAEKEAKSAKETKLEEKTPHEYHPPVLSKKIKGDAFKSSLSKAQVGLSRPERVFSKVVHLPIVDRVSEIGAKTVARPTSLLTAGFIALLGSSMFLFMAHRYGFRYNLLLFFALFVSGYLLGLIFEALRVLVRGPRR
ncbi:hypothetical protein A3D14_01260 [Candidatus Saccharibacteria bacterium RIFCSPHIGHO2_02_FULL_47_12]|nr:MAG: hypothetical protein A3D14_01260 [Candidatus Saccharibacteria bacterium RIFCSPHIGHO2_02_FULL_47_12]